MKKLMARHKLHQNKVAAQDVETKKTETKSCSVVRHEDERQRHVEDYFFLFLKFLSTILPTVDYDTSFSV